MEQSASRQFPQTSWTTLKLALLLPIAPFFTPKQKGLSFLTWLGQHLNMSSSTNKSIWVVIVMRTKVTMVMCCVTVWEEALQGLGLGHPPSLLHGAVTSSTCTGAILLFHWGSWLGCFEMIAIPVERQITHIDNKQQCILNVIKEAEYGGHEVYCRRRCAINHENAEGVWYQS